MKSALLYGRPVLNPQEKIKNIGSVKPNQYDTITCVASGLMKNNWNIVWADLKKYPNGYKPGFDLVAVNCFWKNQEIIRELHKNERVILMEGGYLFRQNNFRSLFINKPHGIPKKAPENDVQRAIDLKFTACSMNKPTKTRDTILILPPGAIINNEYSSVREWIISAYKILSEKVDIEKFEVIIRPHPSCIEDIESLSSILGAVYENPRERLVEDSIAVSNFVIVENTSAGLYCFLLNVPMFCSEKASYAYLCKRWEDIRQDFTSFYDLEKVQDFLNRVAWTQWLPNEIISGSWVRHIDELFG